MGENCRDLVDCSMSEFLWKYWEKPQRTLLIMASLLTEIWNRVFLNMTQEI